MGIIQKDTIRTLFISYLGLILGYVNKGVLFVLILSTEQIGLINLILSVGLLFSQLANLGTINSIPKFLPLFNNNKDQKQQFFGFNLLIILIGSLLFTALSFLLKEPITVYYSDKSALFVDYYYYWIIPIGIANVFSGIFETYLRAIFKNILSVFVFEFLLRILTSILLVLMMLKIIDFELFFIFHSIIYFIPTMVLLLYLIKLNEVTFSKSKLKLSTKFKKIIFSFSLYSYANTLGVLIVMTMDALMIAYFLGLKETGVYTTVIYLTSVIQIPYKSLMKISSPLIPQYWKERNLEKMQSLYLKTSSISLVTVLFLFLLIWINIHYLFSFLPPEYITGIWVFLFLMIGRIIDMYFGINGTILVNSKKYKYDILFTFILLILVFVLNCWLIPIYGIIGAAISTAVAMVVYNLCRMTFLFYSYKIHPFEKNQFYIISLFSGILILMTFTPQFSDFKLLVLIVKSTIAAILYFGVIILFRLNVDLNQYLDKILKSKLKIHIPFLEK